MWMIYVNLSTNNAIENKNIEYVYWFFFGTVGRYREKFK